MLRLLADENFNNKIVRALLRHESDLDIVRVQDVGLSGADDATVLTWAAAENRVLLIHDVSTITKYAYDRVRAVTRCQVSSRLHRKVPSARSSRISYY